eukprot:CAMPEP_0198144296 /NCGR_PEP_ID=MMETSP1443-20131203/14355_1 /TAXON_ID=186043 /ORGANISM="Entomoneis sp., Strain CCMP2396" /LENGTH=222 /DNA_ID=CAMNT_0043807659 /DNA_START=360 /DNA_END=1028 /DNA_ORIENTATION=+
MWNKNKKRATSSGGSSSLSGINEAAAEKMFAEIADPDDPQTANMEGIFTLGEKLDIDATEDIRILVLLWKMGVRDQPSQMSKQEWLQGCASLQADSWDKFRNTVLPSLDTGFLEQPDFKDFYKFCFTFSRQGTHKSLDKELTLALLKLVLSGDRIPKDRLDSFTSFLEENSTYTHINLDQWTSFLDFCLEVQDLSNYDESTSAWPVMIDEYVDFMEELQKKK